MICTACWRKNLLRSNSLTGPAASPACRLITALALTLFVQQAAGAESSPRSLFSRPEINWATTWINTALPQFMQKGIIAKISNKNDNFEVYAGKPWRELSFMQQGEFLKNLARAREITGHPPFFSVVDSSSSETLARVSGSAIEILTPDGSFKFYVPQDPDILQPPAAEP